MKINWNLFLYFLLGAVGIWLCARLILPVGLPFLLGFLIARCARPLRPRRWPPVFSGIFSVSLFFLMLCILLWILGKTLFSEAQQLAKGLPAVLQELSPVLQNAYLRLTDFASGLPETVAPIAVDWIERLFAGSSILLTGASEGLLSLAGRLLSGVPNFILFVLTALLSAYFYSVDSHKLLPLVQKHVPEVWLQKAHSLYRRIKHALGSYAKSQLYLSAVSLILCAIGLLILRKDSALLLSLGIAVVDALPVLGAGAVLIPWGLLSFLRGSTGDGVGLLLIYAVIAIARTALEPRFLGKQMGLHPLLTLLSLYGGFRLFGVSGMILVPVGVMLCKQLYELSREF
ncbi:MAG: sporulation integral membrane protein YtvI [Oscillospiraceae bacterium]|nr:sporulation integral membrane protein YtvI [Oscillospiraceae bacterium]